MEAKSSLSDISIRSTDCLGVCSPGHVIGFADPDKCGFVFNGMDNNEVVKDLTNTVVEGFKTGEYTLTSQLRTKLEGRIQIDRLDQLPFQD